jgi:predicted methyltransferase
MSPIIERIHTNESKGKLVRITRRILIAAACLAGFSGTAMAVAPDFMDKLTADSRPMEDKNRDGARRPYQVMMLLGVEEGMTVVDVGSGGGWYTRVLSAAVGPSGKVIAQGFRGDSASIEALGNVEIVADLGDIAANTADVTVTALNIHHMNTERAVPYMRDILRIMKPGSVATIIDHVGDPSIDNSRLHRVPVADARAWIESAGFEIVSQPDILRQNADDHTMSATDPRLGRDPDRFMFIVRKPD